jgi:hypothetical protein
MAKSLTSYEAYFNNTLSGMSDHFRLYVYKQCELHDGDRWKGEECYLIRIIYTVTSTNAKTFIGEFVIDRGFWHQSNTTIKDRKFMRACADAHLDPIREAVKVERAKAKAKAK